MFHIFAMNVSVFLYTYYAYCELNYHDQKIRRTRTHDIGEHSVPVFSGRGNSIHNINSST